ncbi:HNH endonuclease signature motif containing protein [Cryobacterium sp. BB307]|uniref:HNH endonuclease signature motif containing protein n=1 Tax=Cryobacterium sp. BB307 TaxID=2716317 RepID=UPI0014455C22|nr:HNH endonuclease signature motif containing protein [Cryobacterium sp. BB307]
MTTTTRFDPLAPGAVAGIRDLGDDALVVAARTLEEDFGRLVDASRLAIAAEVEHRSRRTLGGDGLAGKLGCRSGTELLERTTGATVATIRRRVRLGEKLRSRFGLTGEVFPAQFPVLAAALSEGRLSQDMAAAIVDELAPTIDRVNPDHLRAAESALVESATEPTTTAEELKIQATVWRITIDPDGVEPAEEEALARRGIRLGKAVGGLVPITGNLTPMVAAQLRRLFNAYLTPRTAPAFLPSDGDESSGAEGPVMEDDRTPDQQRHDVLGGILSAAARDPETPKVNGAAPTVLVTVTANDLNQGTGAGWVDGIDLPISLRSMRQLACTGETQTVTLDATGAVIQLTSPTRGFTPQQRKAIGARDGYHCAAPGCGTPGDWCEIHHVTPHAEGGPTEVDNGVLLCWYHHRTLGTSGWEIRINDGVPEFKPPPWINPDGTWIRTTKAKPRLTAALKRALKDT